MDLQEHAKAIWSTLDSLAAQNPEEYKKFIKEQLGEAEKELKSTGKGHGQLQGHKDGGSVKVETDSEDFRNIIEDLAGIFWGSLSIGKSRQTATTSTVSMTKDMSKGDQKERAAGSRETIDHVGHPSSLLLNINAAPGEAKEAEEEEQGIIELKLPGQMELKKKPLIEEL